MTATAATQWQKQLHRKISKELNLSQEHDKISSLKLRADRLREIRTKRLNQRFD